VFERTSPQRITSSLVLPRLDKKADDGFFAERLGGAVQALNEHETRSNGSLGEIVVPELYSAQRHLFDHLVGCR
jgi:hypothetical protein